MRILILNADYPLFLRSLYAASPGLSEQSYAAQMAARNDSLFGVADFYSCNLKAHGHEAAELHVNNALLQAAWAREHGMTARSAGDSSPAGGTIGRGARRLLRPALGPVARFLRAPGMRRHESETVRAQVEDFRPDVILNHDMEYVRSSFLQTLRAPGRLIVGQLAAAIPKGETFGAYDLVISSLPNLVTWFRGQGVAAELNRLAFEPAVLARLGAAPERDIEISFVGSLSPDHRGRIELLERVARDVPLQVWGTGIERLPASSILHRIYRGEAWGSDMYRILRRSRITLNHHIDLAEDWANNMRLYEATGMGAALVTDAKRNLHEIFSPGEEVVVYRSPDDCVAQVQRYLADEPARGAIAAAGQRHAVEVHNYYRRMGELLELLHDRMAPTGRRVS